MVLEAIEKTGEIIKKEIINELSKFNNNCFTGSIKIELHIKDGGIGDSDIQTLRKSVHKE